MKDVARLAGVSTSTVSHVINNNRFVSDGVRKKVDDAITELNYAPSALARSLKMNRTQTIGMLVTTSNNPFYAEVVRGVERSCYERGYSLILCNTEGDHQRMNSSLETLLQKRVDGLLLMCTETRGPSPDVFSRYPRIPMVMMDWSPFEYGGDIIQDNSFLGGEIATNHLIENGFTHIACIAGPLDKSPAKSRLEGFYCAMSQAGLNVPAEYVLESDFEFSGGFTAMNKLLSLPVLPQAVFAGNDAMAVGAYQAIYQKGLRV
ncbi:LacI family DNA-binding transcriptional regulator, partial [Morganella psychrotolerans]|uniref:LacI family DNA-binding transcriptional regulator n=1 Tax=Morganella psychrotolerans TaxID=368603 RepID=UPI0039AF983F